MRRGIVALLFCVLMLSACGKRQPLPQGPRVAKGMLERVGISLTRRGTHALFRNGERFTYVESSVVALHQLEGRMVELQGIYEENADGRDLPVFVATAVVSGDRGQVRAWTLPTLGASFSVPRDWRGDVSTSVAQFTRSGSSLPVLRVLVEASAALPFNFRTLTATGTSLTLTPLVIGTRKAVGVESEGRAAYTVYVDLDSASPTDERLLAFVFRLDPDDEATAVMQRQDALAVVRSLTFRAVLAPVVRPPLTGTAGSADGKKPCGGPAGVLCPEGLSCQITDSATDIGVCRRI